MVRLTVLASGSRGNSAVLSSGDVSILVDAGLSCRETLRRMHNAGERPENLTAILISHEHQDHVSGLAVLARKLQIPVYMTVSTHKAWAKWVRPTVRTSYAKWLAAKEAAITGQATTLVTLEPEEPVGADQSEIESDFLALDEAEGSGCDAPVQLELQALADKTRDPAELPFLQNFVSGVPFRIGKFGVAPFTIPHDATDPVGFVFAVEGANIAVVTDLGYIPVSVRTHLAGCDCLMIESNHDVEMLRYGPYPWSVKQRVMSRVGHLSNDALAEFLATDYDGGASFVVLAHISESNNHPELARNSAERALGDRRNLLGNRLFLAKQTEPLEPICF